MLISDATECPQNRRFSQAAPLDVHEDFNGIVVEGTEVELHPAERTIRTLPCDKVNKTRLHYTSNFTHLDRALYPLIDQLCCVGATI